MSLSAGFPCMTPLWKPRMRELALSYIKDISYCLFWEIVFFHTSTIVRFVEVSKKCNVSQSSLYSLLTTPYNVSFTKLCQYNTEILIFLPCRLTYKKAFFTQAKEEKKQRIQPYLYRLVFNEYFWKFFSELHWIGLP